MVTFLIFPGDPSLRVKRCIDLNRAGSKQRCYITSLWCFQEGSLLTVNLAFTFSGGMDCRFIKPCVWSGLGTRLLSRLATEARRTFLVPRLKTYDFRVTPLKISFYYIDTDEIPGFFLLLKNHIFIARWKYYFYLSRVRILVSPWLLTYGYEFYLLELKVSLTRSLRSLVRDTSSTRR